MKPMTTRARAAEWEKVKTEIEPFRGNKAAYKRLMAIINPLHKKIGEGY